MGLSVTSNVHYLGIMYMRDLGWGYLLPGHNVHERFRVGLS